MGSLELRQWITLNHPAYAVTLSDDGQYVAVGTEEGVTIFNVTGRRLCVYPPGDAAMPVHQLTATPDLSRLYVGARQGWLIRLDLEREGEIFGFHAQILYQAENDLHTIALSSDGQFIGVGHLSPGLALLQADGHVLWRRHPDDGTATEGQIWTVALDAEGHTMYVGSAGSGSNILAALEARTGSPQTRHYLEAGVRVTGLAALPGGTGVAVVLTEDLYTSRLVVHDAGLSDLIWERIFDEPITALTADRERPILAVSIGYEGQVAIADAETGRPLASDLALKSVANGLAIVQGRFLAAATQDGHLVLIRYLSKELHP